MKYLIIILGLFFNIFCSKNQVKQDSNYTVVTTAIPKGEMDSVAIQSIRDFYIRYITENSKDEVDYGRVDEIKNKYVSDRLINEINNGEYDFDPFVNSQDFSITWLENLRIIKNNNSKETYIVSFGQAGVFKNLSIIVVPESNIFKIDKIEYLPTSTGLKNNEWIGDYEGSFLRMEPEKSDPRAYATVNLKVQNDGIILNYYSFLEELNSSLVLKKEQSNQLNLSFNIPESTKGTMVLIKKGNKYFLESAYIDSLMEKNTQIEMMKK